MMLSIKQAVCTQKSTGAIVRPITIVSLCCVALVYAASFSSGVYNEYVYNYEATVYGPSGFRIKAKASLDILYASKAEPNKLLDNEIGQTDSELCQASDSLLVRLKLTEPLFFSGSSDDNAQPLTIESKYNKIYNPEHNLYAHIVTLANGTAIVKEVFTHQSDATTFKNIKKAILLNLLPTPHHQKVQPHELHSEYISVRPLDADPATKSHCITHGNEEDQPELFSPDSISQVRIVAKTRKASSAESTTASNAINGKQINLPVVFQTVDGQQNVTFRSRVLAEAESNLSTTFSLELVDQFKSNAHEKFDQANSMAAAIKLLDDRQKYHSDSVSLERERKICSTHHCAATLAELFQDYRTSLTDESIASVDMAIAFLRLLERLRGSEGTSAKDISAVLKRTRGNQGVESSFLDVLAAARTRDSITAAFKHIKLPKNDNLNVAERFLTVLSASATTAAKMRLKRPLQSPYYYTPTEPLKRSKAAKEQENRLASLEFVASEFLNVFEQIPGEKWASHKLRQSSLLTLATLVNANNQAQNYENANDELNSRVDQIILDELKSCDFEDSECRIVAMQAMSNLDRFGEAQFEVLKDQVMQFGKRESNTAMTVLRDLLQNQTKRKPLEQAFYTNLKNFLLRIVYDQVQETTSRVLAAEMIVRFVPNSLASEELLNHLPSFNNNELATMIYSRIQSLKPDGGLAKHSENWFWKSCIINGTSTSLVQQLAQTQSLNASYGLTIEIPNKSKVPRESYFNLFLDTKQRTQDLFSLGIYARGVAKLVGSGDADEDSDEDLMAGMTLRVLSGNLRPYRFFTGKMEILAHVYAGTANDPTTVFNGNLLLIDHQEGYPLVSGFVAEQKMRGVLSIDVSGQVHVTFSWFGSKSARMNVTTQAAVIVQASQSVFTSYDNLWQSHLSAFGGQGNVDFLLKALDQDRVCMQVTQPRLTARLNLRRHEQKMTKEVSRKITRRNYFIGAKSYSLFSENNKMCSAMVDEL